MHVCLCSAYHFSQYHGGNERYTHELAVALTELGHKITYLTGSHVTQIYPYAIRILPLHHFQKKPLPSIAWLKPNLPPAAILHTTGSGLPLHLLARLTPVPRVHTFQAATHSVSLLGKLGAGLENQLISSTYHQLIVTSPYYQLSSLHLSCLKNHFYPPHVTLNLPKTKFK